MPRQPKIRFMLARLRILVSEEFGFKISQPGYRLRDSLDEGERIDCEEFTGGAFVPSDGQIMAEHKTELTFERLEEINTNWAGCSRRLRPSTWIGRWKEVLASSYVRICLERNRWRVS